MHASLLARLRRAGPILGAVFLSAIAQAQTTHLVGPGGFATIDAAIRVASPGDTILVAPGVHDPFFLNKGVIVRAVPGTHVEISAPILHPTATAIDVPPGQAAHLLDLHFRPVQLGNPWFSGRLEVLGGRVAFVRCSIDGPNQATNMSGATLSIADAEVTFQHCHLRNTFGSGVGLLASSSHVAMFATIVDAPWIHWDLPRIAPNGVRLVRSTLHAARCEINGGDTDSALSNHPPGAGVFASSSSVAWLTDCPVSGGSGRSRHPGAVAVETDRTSRIRHVACTFLGGTGVPNAPPTLGDVALAPGLLRLTSAPLSHAPGAPFTLELRGRPNRPTALMVDFGTAFSRPTEFLQPLWLPARNPFLLAAVGATDGSGRSVLTVVLPRSFDVVRFPLWFQAVVVDASVRTAPPLGGPGGR